MSKRMQTLIGKRKICVGFTRCHLYDIPNHGRCYKCQRPGHFAKDCQNVEACSKCSLGHSFKECKSVSAKCVNCTINSEANADHPSFSKLCPYNRRSLPWFFAEIFLCFLLTLSQLFVCLPAWNIVHAGALRAAFFTRGLKLLALNKYLIVVVVVLCGNL